MHPVAVVLAHQGGWDETLIVLAPLGAIAGLLWLVNKRAKALVLTRAGKRLNLKLGEVTRRARAKLVEKLSTEEQKTLVQLLRKVAGVDEDKSA